MALQEGLLAKFKLSIGDFNVDTTLNDYYTGFLTTAIADLITDDISTSQIESDLGNALTVLYAEALMNKTDIANNSTITLLRNKLAIMTSGDRMLYDLTVTTTNCTVVVTDYNETITAGDLTVYLKENLKITVTADENFTISSIKVNGKSFLNENILKVDGDVEIVAIAE